MDRCSPFRSQFYHRQASPHPRGYEDFLPRRDDSPPMRRSTSRFSDRDRSEYPPLPEPMDRDRDEDQGVLYFSDCIMHPPRPGIDKPITQKTRKPSGCKTLYLGGIPESLMKISRRLEAIVSEVFTANGGEIDVIRVSGRGFCHIRFKKEGSVDMAMAVCGYWMEVKQDYDAPIRFRVMLDYAESLTDTEEFESKKLVASRFNLSSADVPSIPSFSSSAVDSVCTSLKDPHACADSVIILRYWMSSSLNKQTSVRFFNMLQISSTQIKRLQSERAQLDGEHNVMVERYQDKVARLDKEFDHLLKLYTDTRQQKIWDIFSKPQRKSIDQWLKSVRASTNSASANDQEQEYNAKKANAKGNTKSNINEPMSRDNDTLTQEVAALKESLVAMQKQVWEMIAKLQIKDTELEEKQKEIDELKILSMEQPIPAKKRKTECAEAFDLETAKLICALANFLQVYSEGATTECIGKYLKEECDIKIADKELEVTLMRMTDLIVCQTKMVDGNVVTKWRYVKNAPH